MKMREEITMEMNDILLMISWALSLAWAFSTGVSVGANMVMKNIQASIQSLSATLKQFIGGKNG